jgi:hypothetical protein
VRDPHRRQVAAGIPAGAAARLPSADVESARSTRPHCVELTSKVSSLRSSAQGMLRKPMNAHVRCWYSRCRMRHGVLAKERPRRSARRGLRSTWRRGGTSSAPIHAIPSVAVASIQRRARVIQHLHAPPMRDRRFRRSAPPAAGGPLEEPSGRSGLPPAGDSVALNQHAQTACACGRGPCAAAPCLPAIIFLTIRRKSTWDTAATSAPCVRCPMT